MAVQVVHSGGGPVSVNVTTTPAISVTSPQVNVVDVNPVYTSGQPGNTGPQGPQGPAGSNGADGATVTYGVSCETGTGSTEQKIRLTGSDSTTDDVVLAVAGDLSIARTSADKITITNTISNPVLEADTSTSGFGFVVDEDNMSSNLNTKVPTQQSVKAYVDNNVTTANVTTNLATSYQTDRVTVTSSDGTDAVILEATGSQAGVMSVAMHDKLDGIASNADATTSSNVNAAGAIMHSDVAGSATGLITRAASEQYTVVAASTSNISEGSNLYYTDVRADARVSAVIDTDNTLGSPSDTLVPSQAAIKTYVDNQLGTQGLSIGTITGTEVSINITGGGSSVTIPAATTSDAGVMTEAQFDKLAGIEAGADATDATNVAAAGALMDSEVTNLAQVKAFDSSDYATSTQGTTADNALPKSGGQMTGNITFSGSQTVDGRDLSVDGAKLDNIEANATADQTNDEIKAAVEAASDSNVFTDADHNKLNAIQSNADVTDSNNVVAALVSATSISGGNQTSIKSNLGITDPAATNNLSDVSTGGSANGQLLIYDAGTNTYDPATLTEGSNITITEGAGSITIASTASGGASSLNDLTDVAITGSGANKYLVRDSSNSNYVNQALDISHDTDPDLGGDLDVGDHSIITSTGNKNITLNPDGTGNVILGNFVFDVDQTVGSGQDNYVLTYDHAGGSGSKISLEPASTASGTVDTSGTPADDQIAIFTDADTIEGQANLTFASNTLTVKAATGAAGFGGRLLFGVDTPDQYNGDIVNFGSGPGGTNGNIEKGKLYYLDSSQQWELADANAVATAKGMLGIAVVDDSPNFLVRGFARHGSWVSLGTGNPLYISAGATAGEITNSAPTGSTDVVRVIGYSTNSGSREIFFNPSNDWLELT